MNPTASRDAEPLVVIGAGSHGRIVAEAARLSGHWTVVAIGDDNPGRVGACLDGVIVVAVEDLPKPSRVVVGVGHGPARARLLASAIAAGHRPAIVIHPTAVVSPTVTLGGGTVVLAGAVIQAGARVGDNVIVNAGAIVDHEAVIRDLAHVGLGARVACRGVVGAGEVLPPGSLRLERSGG